jgi:hypothetical protein
MSLEVRYFLSGRQVAQEAAATMYEARRLTGAAPSRDADAAAIFALTDDGRELELERLDARLSAAC